MAEGRRVRFAEGAPEDRRERGAGGDSARSGLQRARRMRHVGEDAGVRGEEVGGEGGRGQAMPRRRRGRTGERRGGSFAALRRFRETSAHPLGDDAAGYLLEAMEGVGSGDSDDDGEEAGSAEDVEDGDGATEDESADEDDGRVRVRCEAAFSPDDAVGSTNAQAGREVEWTTGPKATIGTFDAGVRKHLVELLEGDEVLLERLHEKKELLAYEVVFNIEPFCGENAYRPAESAHVFETVGDLFEDPGVEELVLKVQVKASATPRPEKIKNHRDRAFHRPDEASIEPADLVVETSELRKEFDGWTYGHARIGNVLERDKFNDASDSEDASDSDDGSVPVRKMLIGEWFEGQDSSRQDHFHDAAGLSLTEVEAWDFGDFAIGDLGVCAKRDFTVGDDFLPPYEGVKDHEELAERVLERRSIEGETTELGSGVPFMPTHTLNGLDSAALGLGWPVSSEGVIPTVVRLVDHIGRRKKAMDKPSEALSPPWLPFNLQLEIMGDDDAREVKRAILAAMREVAERHPSPVSEPKVLRKFVEETDWELQLWVLPRGFRKMYRFPNPHAKAWGGLTQYLPGDLKPGRGPLGRALYLEAHIVFKRGMDADRAHDISGGNGKQKDGPARESQTRRGKARRDSIDDGGNRRSGSQLRTTTRPGSR